MFTESVQINLSFRIRLVSLLRHFITSYPSETFALVKNILSGSILLEKIRSENHIICKLSN